MITELKKQIEAQKHLSTSPIYTPDKDWPGMWVIIHPHWFDQLLEIAEMSLPENGRSCHLCGDLGEMWSEVGIDGMEDNWYPSPHQPTCPYSEEYKPCG